MGLIKNILIVIGVGVALLGLRVCQAADEKTGGSARGDGFVAMPRPQNTVPGKVLLIGPQNCSREAGVRSDRLERAIHAAGIPCVRLTTVNITPSSQSEASRVNKVMGGDLPIVFVGGYAINNPTIDQIKAQFLRTR